MSPTAIAVVIAVVGYGLLVAGCALIAAWLALVVAGGTLLAVAFAIEAPEGRKRP